MDDVTQAKFKGVCACELVNVLKAEGDDVTRAMPKGVGCL